MDQPSTPVAAVLLIGDELLSGKIRDENGAFLARVLRRRGILLREMTTVADGLDDIGEALLRLSGRAQLLFTSGGVGPTHDDRTLEAIAQATGRRLHRHPEMEQSLRQHYGPDITPAALRMADVPEGTTLCAGPGWPVLRLQVDACRVYILPGVPALLRAKIERLENLDGELPQAGGWHCRQLFTTLDEAHLTPHLDAVVRTFPDVDIGSYPRWSQGHDGRLRVHVKVTLEAPASRATRADAAVGALQDRLPADALLPADPLVGGPS